MTLHVFRYWQKLKHPIQKFLDSLFLLFEQLKYRDPKLPVILPQDRLFTKSCSKFPQTVRGAAIDDCRRSTIVKVLTQESYKQREIALQEAIVRSPESQASR